MTYSQSFIVYFSTDYFLKISRQRVTGEYVEYECVKYSFLLVEVLSVPTLI